jgi:RHS repeat-associated protein
VSREVYVRSHWKSVPGPDSTTTSSGFDDDGRLTSVTSNNLTTSFGYDAAGNVTSVTLPSGNGYVESHSFDRAGRLTTVDNAKSGTSLSKFVWTLDAAGNPTRVQTTRGGTDSYDIYGYDTRNRLTDSCFDVGSGAGDCSAATNRITYSYDKVSNRLQEVRSGSVGDTGTIAYTYNSADQLTQTSKGGVNTTYTYDANGNETSDGTHTFTYNLADQLASSTSGGTSTTYGYDGDGLRVSSSTSGGADLRYTWDPLADDGLPELALEQDPNGNLIRRYLDGPLGAVSMTNPDGTFYYHHDPLNNVTDLTDATGNPQWQYKYDAYGAPLTATNVSGTAPDNPLRFNSQYLDTETGAYNLRAREYDASTGRFVAVDPLELPLAETYASAYLYAAARPSVLTDPSGLRWCDPVCGAVKVISGVGRGVGDVAQGAIVAPWQVFSGELGTRLGNYLYSCSPQGGLMIVSCAALFITTPFFSCYDAIRAGDDTAIGRDCTNAAALVAGPLAARWASRVGLPWASRLAYERYVRRFRCELTADARRHILDRHFPGGRLVGKDKSIFNFNEDLDRLTRAARRVAPIPQRNGNFVRIVDAGRPIGVDRATGRLTSIYSVVTDRNGEVVTAFPGVPRPMR